MVADSLNRRRHEVAVVSLSVDLRSRIISALPSDSWYQEVRAEIASGGDLDGRYTIYSLEFDGLLLYLGHIYVPPSNDLRVLILS